jgi:glycosyltransferase involved in cell wall biosynthesis
MARIYLDASDLVYHAIWHSTCGGIARVQLEVAAALVRSDLPVTAFSVYDEIWRDLRPLIYESGGVADQLLRRSRQFKLYPGVYPSLSRPVLTAKLLRARLGELCNRLRSRVPRLTADDTLFVGGELWTSRTSVRLRKQAADNGTNLIILIHDLIPITNPQFCGHDFAVEFLEALRLAAHFIVTTPFNKDELARIRREHGLQPAPVSVVPLADEFPDTQRNERGLLPPKEGERLAGCAFVLCVGTVAARKNHLMLLSVWEELHAELGDRLPILVVAGQRGWNAEEALRKLDDSVGSGSRIIFQEAPSDELLRWLYSACQFTVFPSVLEGWGLPVGESLWFGKACAASNSSSIPIVGRDLCVYFSPDEPLQMKAAIRSLLDPTIRRSYESRIKEARLRTWAEVANDIKEIITRPRIVVS